MNNHYIVIDGKYPWGISPFGYGFITLSWKILVLIYFLFSFLAGFGNLGITLLIALFPEIWLVVYELLRMKKAGWIITPILNSMKSLNQIKESRPVYCTIFGYNRIEKAPIFYIDLKSNSEYLITFEPNGCPNADKDILPILQQEMPSYELIAIGSVKKQYLIRKRRRKGNRLNNADFY